MTILLSKFISDQGAKLALFNFGEVVPVFKGRHKFNRFIKNVKKHVRIFPAGGGPAMLSRKISFHGNIQRNILSLKRWCCATGAKLVACFAKNCPVIKKIPGCLSLSGMLLLYGIQALDSFIILQKFFLALNLCNNLLLR